MSDLFVSGSSLRSVNKQDNFLSPDLKATELRSHISWVQTQRKKELLPDILALRNHKSKQVRRKIIETISQLGDTSHIEVLQEWQLQESDRQTWLSIESAIDRLKRGEAGQDRQHHERVFSISEALKLIKDRVSEKEFVLEGELAEVKLSRNLYWIALKDAQDIRLDALLLNHRAVQAGFPLNEGLKVRVFGRFKISVKSSRLYFDIQRIELTGEGELIRSLEILKAKLTQEGLFDPGRKSTPAKLPQHILLIASPDSAAVTDFCRVLGERRKGVKIYLLPIKTQGTGAEYEVLSQLQRTNKLIDQYAIDTVVMSRGGGSKDDLMVFNSEKVVRAIAHIKQPMIVAIGHERDTTFAELVTDVRAATPSQAAEMSSWSAEQTNYMLKSFQEETMRLFQQRTHEYTSFTKRVVQYNYQKLLQRLHYIRSEIRQTDTVSFSLIHSARLFNQNSYQQILTTVSSHLKEYSHQLDLLHDPYRLCSVWKSELQYEYKNICTQIKLRDPKLIMKQGYAVVTQQGEVVSKVDKVSKEKALTIHLQDGIVEVSDAGIVSKVEEN